MKNLLNKEEISKFRGITCDSREVKPGYVFVAITGFEDDGNKYIDQAIKKGARAIITEKPIKNKNVPVFQVNDSRAVLGKLAAHFYDFPSNKLELIGVTGTNGKTTTTHLIYNLLNYQKKQTGLIGTVQIDTGDKIKPGKLTTPPPMILQKKLHQMVENNLKYCCMEVSSHGIQLKRIEATNFAVKVGTNITMDHYDLHQDFSEYVEVKKSFLNKNEKGLVLINQDDPYLNKINNNKNIQINVSIDKETAVRARNINYREIKTEFVYSLNKPLKNEDTIVPPVDFPVQMMLPGKHNIYNSLIAITIGLYYGLKPTLIQNFFNSYNGVWRRLEIIYNRNFTIIDDCAHNPGSYNAVFRAIQNMSYNNLFIVNSLRGNRGMKINKANAETISNWLSLYNNYKLFTSNCNEVVKPIDKVKQKEEEIFLQTLNQENIKYTHFKKLKPALETTLTRVNKGDLVLLLGPHAMDKAGEMMLDLL